MEGTPIAQILDSEGNTPDPIDSESGIEDQKPMEGPSLLEQQL